MPVHATGNNTQVNGIIPFGSSDEAVILQDSLRYTGTDTPSNGHVVGTGEFSAVGLDTGGAGGWTFDLSALDFNSLEIAGQFSITMPASFLAQELTSSSYGSDGDDLSGYNQWIMSWSNTDTTSAAMNGRFCISKSGVEKKLFVQMEWGNTTFPPTVFKVSDHVNDSIVYTVSWNSQYVLHYLDGALVYTFDSGVNPSDLFKFIHLGTDRGNTGTGFIMDGGYPLKDFIISNRQVMLATHPALADVGVMGDSFGVLFDRDTTDTYNGYQYGMFFTMQAHLAKRGLRVSLPDPSSASGLYSTAHNGDVIDDTTSAAAGIPAQATAMLANNPHQIIIFGGINDVINPSYSATSFESEYKSMINALLASSTSVQKLYLVTPFSPKGDVLVYTAAVQAAEASVYSITKALPDWWDTNNPSETGKVILVDVYAAMGGNSTAADKYISGLWSSSFANYEDDVHPSTRGHELIGRMLGQALYNNL